MKTNPLHFRYTQGVRCAQLPFGGGFFIPKFGTILGMMRTWKGVVGIFAGAHVLFLHTKTALYDGNPTPVISHRPVNRR